MPFPPKHITTNANANFLGSFRSKGSFSGVYEYSFNTQMHTDEISGTGNHTTALFWEYDTRLGRRWNLDPVTYPWQSSYAVNNNNPIIFTDPLGLFGTRREARKYKKENRESLGRGAKIRKNKEYGGFQIIDKKNFRVIFRNKYATGLVMYGKLIKDGIVEMYYKEGKNEMDEFHKEAPFLSDWTNGVHVWGFSESYKWAYHAPKSKNVTQTFDFREFWNLINGTKSKRPYPSKFEINPKEKVTTDAEDWHNKALDQFANQYKYNVKISNPNSLEIIRKVEANTPHGKAIFNTNDRGDTTSVLIVDSVEYKNNWDASVFKHYFRKNKKGEYEKVR